MSRVIQLHQLPLFISKSRTGLKTWRHTHSLIWHRRARAQTASARLLRALLPQWQSHHAKRASSPGMLSPVSFLISSVPLFSHSLFFFPSPPLVFCHSYITTGLYHTPSSCMRHYSQMSSGTHVCAGHSCTSREGGWGGIKAAHIQSTDATCAKRGATHTDDQSQCNTHACTQHTHNISMCVESFDLSKACCIWPTYADWS